MPSASGSRNLDETPSAVMRTVSFAFPKVHGCPASPVLEPYPARGLDLPGAAGFEHARRSPARRLPAERRQPLPSAFGPRARPSAYVPVQPVLDVLDHPRTQSQTRLSAHAPPYADDVLETREDVCYATAGHRRDAGECSAHPTGTGRRTPSGAPAFWSGYDASIVLAFTDSEHDPPLRQSSGRAQAHARGPRRRIESGTRLARKYLVYASGVLGIRERRLSGPARRRLASPSATRASRGGGPASVAARGCGSYGQRPRLCKHSASFF